MMKNNSNISCSSGSGLNNSTGNNQLCTHNIKECPFLSQSFIIINNELRVLKLSHLAKGLLRYSNSITTDLDKPIYLDNLLKVKKSYKKEGSSFLNILAKLAEGSTLSLTTCLHPLSPNVTIWFLVPQSKLMNIDRGPSPIPSEISQLLYTFNPALAIKVTTHGLIRSINTQDSPLIPNYFPKIQLLPIFELIHPSDTQKFCQCLSQSLKTKLNFKFKLRWICFDYDHRYNQRHIDCGASEDGSVTKVNYGGEYESEGEISDNFDYEADSDTSEYTYINHPQKLTSKKRKQLQYQNYYEVEWVQITCKPCDEGGDLTLVVEPSSAPKPSSITNSPHILIQLANYFTKYLKQTISIFKYIPLERATLLKALVSILGLLCQLDYFITTPELKLWKSSLQSITPSKCYEMGQINLNQSGRGSHKIDSMSSFWPILGLVVQLAVFRLPQAVWNRMKHWIL
jgi:hypothetical protein